MQRFPEYIIPKPILFCISVIVLFNLSFAAWSAEFPDEGQCRTLWQQNRTIKPTVEGWCLFIDRSKGNCLACHGIEFAGWPNTLHAAGNIGPYLEQINQKFPDRTGLERIIADPSLKNPRTVMPKFGRHRILTRAEINLIVEFLMSIH